MDLSHFQNQLLIYCLTLYKNHQFTSMWICIVVLQARAQNGIWIWVSFWHHRALKPSQVMTTLNISLDESQLTFSTEVLSILIRCKTLSVNINLQPFFNDYYFYFWILRHNVSSLVRKLICLTWHADRRNIWRADILLPPTRFWCLKRDFKILRGGPSFPKFIFTDAEETDR